MAGAPTSKGGRVNSLFWSFSPRSRIYIKLKNIKECKNSTCWLSSVVIVKLWFSVLLNLKSDIIIHPRVTNDDVPSNL